MSRVFTSPTPIGAGRIAAVALLAFACVSVFSMVGMTSTARAADPLPICSTAGEIAIQLSDGSARCVENTCEAVLGAEGRASECTQERAPLNASVPESASGISGVAPVRAPVTAAATTPVTNAANADDGTSVGLVLAWVFAGIGVAALLLGAVLFLRTRSRTRAAAAADRSGTTPTASA